MIVHASYSLISECSGNNYGINCSIPCECTPNHTVNVSQSCNRTTGECLCNTFWNGTQCEDDVNECEMNPNICGENTDCNNTIGSYVCTCNAGFTLDNDGNCTVGRYFLYRCCRNRRNSFI